ncbi:cell division activator CedA [Klebsiella pneumoniae]|nr:cell division activator CedA [Klebsiella pneumoniae]
MKPLRQQNRPVISYVPRVEPAPPEHAVKMDHFRDVWILRGKYVAFLLMGGAFPSLTGIQRAGVGAALG